MAKLGRMKTFIFSSVLVLLLGMVAGCNQSVKIEDQTKSSSLSVAAAAPATAAVSTSTKTAPVPAEAAATTKDQTVNTNEVAVIKTTQGEMVIEFWPEVAPKTVENFKKLANEKFYDGTAFHRIVKGFMIQGGDPLTKDPSKEALWGTGDPGYKIKAEFNDRKHVRGVISMARAMDPDSAGCQFFICLDNAPNLDGQYTAFGKLIKGDDVLGKLGDAETVMRGREKSKPVVRQGVESIRIVPASSLK